MFWIVNTLELFERGAYYGMMAVLAYHMSYNLGLDVVQIGALLGILMPLLYFVPVVSAAVGERYGYKKVLTGSFIVYIISYLILAVTGTIIPLEPTAAFITLFIPITLLGVSAGAFKPMVSATIAKVTEPEQRNFGYGIYYWLINFGATAMPLLIGLVFIFLVEDLYFLVFFGTAILLFANLVITITQFKNPAPPNTDKEVIPYVISLFSILKDWRFTLLLLIYSGFWMMFATMHALLPLYMVDFRIMPAWFGVPFLATLNPGTIIVLGPLLAKVSDRFKSLPLMILGMLIYLAGLFIMGILSAKISLGGISVFLLIGIIIFSIGEFLTHPNFISYVSKIAPQDKLAVYMGLAFLPTGIGLTIGTFGWSVMYELIATNGRPALYWSIVVCTGIITVSAFLLYNKYVASGLGSGSVSVKDEAEDGTTPEPQYKPLPGSKIGNYALNSRITPFAILLVIPLLLGAGFIVGESTYYGAEYVDGPETPDVVPWQDYQVVDGAPASYGDYLAENSEYTTTMNITETNVASVVFQLNWQDEPDSRLFGVRPLDNQPDEFSLKVVAPDGKSHTTPVTQNARSENGGTGTVELTIEYTPGDEDPYYNGTGDYEITVICGNCGNQEPQRFGLLAQNDNGNDWALEVVYNYYKAPEKE